MNDYDVTISYHHTLTTNNYEREADKCPIYLRSNLWYAIIYAYGSQRSEFVKLLRHVCHSGGKGQWFLTRDMWSLCEGS